MANARYDSRTYIYVNKKLHPTFWRIVLIEPDYCSINLDVQLSYDILNGPEYGLNTPIGTDLEVRGLGP